MSSDDGKFTEGCVMWIIAALVGCALLALEGLVGRWLFGVFGLDFGFWKSLGIVLAVNFIFGGIRIRASGKG